MAVSLSIFLASFPGLLKQLSEGGYYFTDELTGVETLSRIGREHTLMTKQVGLIWNQVTWPIFSTPRETQSTCYLHQTGVHFGQMVPELVQPSGSGTLLGPSLLSYLPCFQSFGFEL